VAAGFQTPAPAVMGDVLHIYIFWKHVVKGDVGGYRLKTNRLPPSPFDRLRAMAGQGRMKERRNNHNKEETNETTYFYVYCAFKRVTYRHAHFCIG